MISFQWQAWEKSFQEWIAAIGKDITNKKGLIGINPFLTKPVY